MRPRPLLATVCILLGLAPLASAAFETRAREALVMDHDTGMVLLEKNPDVPMPPASMSKLMTLYMLFEAIRDDRVKLDTEFLVSARAQAMGGSRMFVEAGTSVPVEALIHGIITQSGNDACVVVAEGLAGSEAVFAQQMTKRAQDLGMRNSTFKNSSGWPEPGHEMSARDLVILASHIIDDFPQYYPYFAETEFTWNGITQPNRNPLLKLGIGVDGLKTGHTEEAGYGLVGSAVQNGKRVTFTVTGLASERQRAEETEAIVKWAFGAFDTIRFFDEGAEIAQADVWLGETPFVPIVAPKDLQVLVPREDRPGMQARVLYSGPVEAPIAVGQKLAVLRVDIPGKDPIDFDLVAGAEVGRGGLMTRISAAARLTRDRAFGYLPGSRDAAAVSVR